MGPYRARQRRASPQNPDRSTDEHARRHVVPSGKHTCSLYEASIRCPCLIIRLERD